MKKITLLALALIFFSAAAQAKTIDLDKLASAVESVQDGKIKPGSSIDKALDDVTAKLEKKVDKITEKLEKRLDKYEEKIEKAEKATDKIVNMVNNFDSSQIAKYIALAKTIALAVAATFGLLILLLILVFVQLLRVNKTLRNTRA